jgi:methanogenic corrinoid protein MtbC1/DNA-binding Xre family transcriptional regulator
MTEIVLHNQLKTFTDLLLNALLKGDSQEVGRIMDECLDSGITLQSLYVDILGGVQCSIGEMWIGGSVSIAQEHRSTQILLDHLARIRQNIRPRKPLGVRAVIAALPGDHHFLGGRMVSDLLLIDGWEVDFLGADTPTDELVRHCIEVKADLVGLSLTDESYVGQAGETIRKLKAAMPNVKTIIGGRGVMKSDDVMKIGADVIARDGTQAVSEARKAVGVNASSHGLYQTLGEIGSRIHYFRKSQKMSQEKLAAGSGLDRAYISSVENGKQNVTIGALLKLCDALGVDLADLIHGPLQSNN